MIVDAKTDLTGMKFGKWTVIGLAPSNKDNRKMWYCKCDCGTEKSVQGRSLRGGSSKACGRCNEERIERIVKLNFKDEVGNRYGRLTVIERNNKKNGDRPIWRCLCDCGNIINVDAYTLRSGGTKSCGCLRKEYQSYGTQQIMKLLENHNLYYIQEKTFNTCHFPNSKRLFRFDFYVNDNYLIEFDGPQHFKPVGWGTKEEIKNQFKITKKRDKCKDTWCIDNNITLIRIPYTHLDELCIEDLIPNTSAFIVKGG